jgi:hypothetical protein
MQRLLDKLIGIDFILSILPISDSVRLGNYGIIVAGQASLETFVVGLFDGLEDLILVLYHGWQFYL